MHRKYSLTLSHSLLLLTVLSCWSFSAAADGTWSDITPREGFSQWRQEGGVATYRVEDNQVIGTSVSGTPNSFLVTRQVYADFILEYEVFVDTRLNSGVQIRSNLNEEGVVFGYQVEIDPSPRAFSGGLYDERRRGWLYPLSRNEKGRKAFQNGQWNVYRVEAIGNSLRVWVNGIQTVDLVDDATAEGFIGLQVHSIGDSELEGTSVGWRNIRIMTDGLDEHRTANDPGIAHVSYLTNELSDSENRQGWRLLWDGHSSNGWRGARLDRFPDSGWTMNEGILTVEKTDGGESTGPGDIVTEDSFSDFELVFDFRITEVANSGVKYFVDPSLNLGPGSAIGAEFQILDDKRHPDAKQGVNGNRTMGSLYDLITAENLSTPGRAKQVRGIGSWNRGRIVSRDGQVEHWLNNEKIVEYNRHSQMFRALVAYSKYRVWDGFGQWPEGRILLQDHGDTVSFRNIKIREF